MKFLVLAALMPIQAWTASDVSRPTVSFLGTEVSTKVTPEDLASCEKTAKAFITKPMHKALLVERATDHCAVDKKLDDRNYVCPQFKQGLSDAFRGEPTDKDFTAKSFCELTENYFIALRGAARVNNMGSGPLVNFKLSKSCSTSVKKALEPNDKLATEKVPDFWYAFCMNQDCASYLPSRTRWCEVERQPTHSVAVCESAREFALDEITVTDAKDMNADQICEMYGEFVAESGQNVEAYEHVIHKDTRHRLPVPEDQVRALDSSRMTNEATIHMLRDNSGSPVEDVRSSAPRACAAGAALVALVFATA